MTIDEIKKRAIKIAGLLIVTTVFLCAGYIFIVFNWSYSKGERVGFVQKFSEKRWLCKTWEGELQMFSITSAISEKEKFLFSVRDNDVVSKINSSMGKKVLLTYEQHKGVPTSCFGESEYLAVDVKTLD
jgi:hypothetical protein